jgi:peptidyl-Lys metalloendopeptidase
MKLKDKFWKSERTGSDNQGGVILHATSHYVAGGDTDDHVYGRSDAKQLAKDDPDKAQNNADNMEYWAEDL